jgi:hypothetical protein
VLYCKIVTVTHINVHDSSNPSTALSQTYTSGVKTASLNRIHTEESFFRKIIKPDPQVTRIILRLTSEVYRCTTDL